MTLILLFLVSGFFAFTQVIRNQVNPQCISCVHVANYKIMYKCWYMPLGAMVSRPDLCFLVGKYVFLETFLQNAWKHFATALINFLDLATSINQIREAEHLNFHLWLKSNFFPPGFCTGYTVLLHFSLTLSPVLTSLRHKLLSQRIYICP